MLGGSVYIAFIRFTVSLMGVVLLFFLVGQSKFQKKKTILYYGSFCMAIAMLGCVWYVIDWKSCVRMVAFTMYMCFTIFSLWMSKDSFFLTVYKLALIFWLMAVFVIGGLEVSIIFFDCNVWVDIIARILIIGLLAFLIHKYVMLVCILLGIGYILNPGLNKGMTPLRIFQITTNIILTGTLQLLIFRLYRHVGNETEYEREKQLIQMNYRLLERQMEILEESVESGRRIRHDARHHNAVIAEYARRGQNEELLQYLKEYEEEITQGIPEMICGNIAINNILAAYTRKARNEGIQVTLDVEIGKNLTFPSLDLVAILANAYENAIYACMEVKKHLDERECFIQLMIKKRKNKLIVSCRNTCRMEIEFTGGVGVSSIIRTAEKYDGEYDFKNENGVFVFRLIMNTEPIYREDSDFGRARG